MISFHGKQEIKDFYLNRVIKHKLADEIIKGIYWENGKGCAVGCTIHSANHSEYEKELGISRLLAELEDGIFENIPNERAKIWPQQFLEAIKVGSDLSDVWPKFAAWMLTDEKYGVIKYARCEKSKKAVQIVSNYYSTHKKITKEQWRYAAAVANAADAAAYAAYSAAYSAANASAYAANYAAATAADYAAYSAANAAASAAAYAAYSAAAYSAVARTELRIAQADKLLELLRECE